MARVRIKCPYCELELVYELEESSYPQVIYCDEDEGGCGKMFVIKEIITRTVKTFRVEGQE